MCIAPFVLSACAGDELCVKGQKALTSFSLFGNKVEKALDYYVKAANLYKQGQACEMAVVVPFFDLSKPGPKAGETFMKISELQQKSGSNFEAATSLVDAHNAYKKCSATGAIFNFPQKAFVGNELEALPQSYEFQLFQRANYFFFCVNV